MRKTLRKAWHFIWEENSILSWAVNVILAFLIIKFLVYPGLGLVLSTSNPVVAVVSGSMEHDSDFGKWWESHKAFYEGANITKQQFQGFILQNGFNIGDLIIIKGEDPGKLKTGEIIVFDGSGREPIIHRIVSKQEQNGTYFVSTKGDNNQRQIDIETSISEDKIIGKALLRIPVLGYVKIIFVNIMKTITGG